MEKKNGKRKKRDGEKIAKNKERCNEGKKGRKVSKENNGEKGKKMTKSQEK